MGKLHTHTHTNTHIHTHTHTHTHTHIYIYSVQFLKPVYPYSALWTEAAIYCDLSTVTYQTSRCHKAENPNTTVACSQNHQSYTIL